MITSTNSTSTTRCLTSEWQADFVRLLPQIEQSAAIAFRHFGSEAKQEAIQDVTVGAMIAYRRLSLSNRIHLAYPGVLARFGITQYFSGRRSGQRHNVRDVSSAYAQRKKGFRLERLGHYDAGQQSWREMLLEDRRASPADTASARIDFQHWIGTLSERLQKIANVLSTGESTSAVAEMFQISVGRVSQIRRELEQSWLIFQGEIDAPWATQAASMENSLDVCVSCDRAILINPPLAR